MATRISFGFGNTVEKNYSTVGEVRADENLQALLGYGDNVDFFVDGAKASDDTPLTPESVVSIQTQASTKAC